jgi:hypothetical protein
LPPAAAPAVVLALQATAGNRAVTQLLRQPAAVLTPTQARAAVTDVTGRYDEDSIRVLKHFFRRTPDASFTVDDAEAVAKLQQTSRMTPTGKVDETVLNALLAGASQAHAMRSALIHLVVDHAGLDVSAVVSIVHDATVTSASELRTFAGGVGEIRLGNAAFAGYSTMLAEIRKQLAVRPAAATPTAVPATVLKDAPAQRDAIAFNRAKLADSRSIRLVQGATGSPSTGAWDADSVRHVAAKQAAAGRTANGKVDQATLEAIVTGLAGAGGQDAVVHLLIDYYDLDRSHAWDLKFVPTQPPALPGAAAETRALANGVGGVIEIFPFFFTQPFAGMVHTLAHELGHVHQRLQGIASDPLREFLSEGIEIESKSMPEELIESEADIDRLAAGQPPTAFGFLNDVLAMLLHWSHLTPAEKATHHQRFKDLRQIIVTRIATQGTAAQKLKLRPMIQQLQNADAGVP